METANKNELYTIAMNLELPDLLRWCISGKRILEDVCKNDDLWRNRLLRDYPDYEKFNSESFSINSLSLKEAYVFLYQLTWIKKMLGSGETEYDIFLKKNLKLNGIKELTKVPSFNLPNLKELSLSFNDNLTKIPPFNLPKLKKLYLSVNKKLTEVPSFNLPNLKTLALDSNDSLTEIPSFNLPNLENLYLYYNENLTRVPPFDFPTIKNLYLNNNKLTEIPKFNLPKLETIYLDNNNFAEETEKEIRKIYPSGIKKRWN